MAQKKSVSVVVADDHQIIRDAVQSLLDDIASEADITFQLAAFAENGLEAIAAVKSQKPTLLFLDISMPLCSGAEIIHDIRRWSPDTRIIVFTGVTAPGLLAGIVESGVEGLFSKSAPVDTMRKNVPLILQGGRFVATEFLEIIEQGQLLVNLTQRERQILNMIIAGKTNKEVAESLFISPKTVDKHRTSLMNKLDVHSVAQLLARALKDGLIDPAGADGV